MPISYDPKVQITVDGRRLGAEFSMQLVGNVGTALPAELTESPPFSYALDELGRLYGAPRLAGPATGIAESDEEYGARLRRSWDRLVEREREELFVRPSLGRAWHVELAPFETMIDAEAARLEADWDRPMPSVWDHILEAP